jgi:hypothetical protein
LNSERAVRLERRQAPERVMRGEGRAAEDDGVFEEPPRALRLALVAAGQPEQQAEPAVTLVDGQRPLEVVARGRRPPLAVELHAEEVVERAVRGRERRRTFEPAEPRGRAPLLHLRESLADEPRELLGLLTRVVFEHDLQDPLEARTLLRLGLDRLLLPPLAPQFREALPADGA